MSEHFGEVFEELDAVFYVDGGVQATVAYRAHGDGVCESGGEAKVGGLEFVHGMSTFEGVGGGFGVLAWAGYSEGRGVDEAGDGRGVSALGLEEGFGVFALLKLGGEFKARKENHAS